MKKRTHQNEPSKPTNLSRRRFLQILGMGAGGLALGQGGCVTGHVASRQGNQLRIAFYTDVHCRLEWDTPVGMEHAARAINAQKPDIIIGGGDYVTEGFQSTAQKVAPRWDAYMKMHRMFEAPAYPVLGNHDLVNAIPADGLPASPHPKSTFLEKFGLERTYRSFDHAGYHFILLDSVWVSGGRPVYHGFIEPDQIEWLKRDLSSVARNTPIVVATHISLLTGVYGFENGAPVHAKPNRVITNNREVMNILKDHNLVVVLQGHQHVEETLRWNGVTYVTGGAVCGKWWRGAYLGTSPGFGMITLADNNVAWNYINYDWTPRRPSPKKKT